MSKCAVGVAIFHPPDSPSYQWALATHDSSWRADDVHIYQITPLPVPSPAHNLNPNPNSGSRSPVSPNSPTSRSFPNVSHTKSTVQTPRLPTQWTEHHFTTALSTLPSLLGIIQILAASPASATKSKHPCPATGLTSSALDAFIHELGPHQDAYNTRGRGWGNLSYVLRIIENLAEAGLVNVGGGPGGRMSVEEMMLEGEALGAKLEMLREGLGRGVPVIDISGGGRVP